MSKSCCEDKASELEKLRNKHGSILKIVLAINALMFIVEFTSGILARSTALMADSLDMFGDAVVYSFSLYALHRGPIWRARAGLSKGVVMAAFGVFVLLQAKVRFISGTVPASDTMGFIGAVALVANLICLGLLYQFRDDDINMRSTWLCSRNDIIANVSVLGASALVAFLNSNIPDVIVGCMIAILFLKSSREVITNARRELKTISIEATP